MMIRQGMPQAYRREQDIPRGEEVVIRVDESVIVEAINRLAASTPHLYAHQIPDRSMITKIEGLEAESLPPGGWYIRITYRPPQP